MLGLMTGAEVVRQVQPSLLGVERAQSFIVPVVCRFFPMLSGAIICRSTVRGRKLVLLSAPGGGQAKQRCRAAALNPGAFTNAKSRVQDDKSLSLTTSAQGAQRAPVGCGGRLLPGRRIRRCAALRRSRSACLDAAGPIARQHHVGLRELVAGRQDLVVDFGSCVRQQRGEPCRVVRRHDRVGLP